jgi:phosphatidylinositol alpha-1,6-mannosyltransferase
MPWVRFTGFLEHGNVAVTYRSMDIFAMPSIQVGAMIEGFGMVFLEAGAAELPSICGSGGGQREAVLDGRTGIVVDGSQLEDVKQALKRLASNASLRRTMGQAGLKYAQEHDWRTSAAAVFAAVGEIGKRQPD